MTHESIVACCPESLPVNLLQLEQSTTDELTSTEVQTIFNNVWELSREVLQGQQPFYEGRADVGVWNGRSFVSLPFVVPLYHPACGFTISAFALPTEQPKEINIDYKRIACDPSATQYQRLRYSLRTDGSARKVQENRIIERCFGRYDLRQPIIASTESISTFDIAVLEEIYDCLAHGDKMSDEPLVRDTEAASKPSLHGYIGRQLRRLWQRPDNARA